MNVDRRRLSMPTKLAERWFAHRTYTPGMFRSTAELVALKRAQGARISVGIPALNEEATIGRICEIIRSGLMQEHPLVDELVVLDGASTDATAMRARTAGAQVLDVSEVMPSVPFQRGKGESLWRSLAALDGDIIVWVDADIRNFEPHFVTRLVDPLLTDPTVDFVKAFYERPIQIDGVLMPTGGGRVTELLARPLLDLLFPELAGIMQPLSGEYAGRARVLRKLPFFSGYSVEAGMLIDLLSVTGLDAIAQADLGTRVHRNRPLDELGPMATTIARTILRRAEEHGRIGPLTELPESPLLIRGVEDRLEATPIEEIERPPLSAPSRVGRQELIELAR